MNKKCEWHLKCSTQLPYEIVAHLQPFAALIVCPGANKHKTHVTTNTTTTKISGQQQQVLQVPLAVEVQVQMRPREDAIYSNRHFGILNLGLGK